MKYSKQILVGVLGMLVISSTLAQTKITGDINTLLNTEINNLPGSFTNAYNPPSSTEAAEWNLLIGSIVDEDYSDAAIQATALDYELFEVTDGTSVYYLLKRAQDSNNYWGVYAFNSAACRTNLVIQSPHPIADLNTGKQGAYVFRETQAYAFFLSGTHRCNNTSFSSCSGTTSICAGSSEKYKISDVAHNTNAAFQISTEVIKDKRNPYFIQLHGFGKNSNDPYVIMSNGARVLEGTDKMVNIQEHLEAEDNTLTFKLSHIDLDWTRLLGFTNTQGRYVNNSNDPCSTNASKSTGRFIHIEQELSKLRSSQSQWAKMANALSNTFECGEITAVDDNLDFNPIRTYPNPASSSFVFESSDFNTYSVKIIGVTGNSVQSFDLVSKKTLQLDGWDKGIYLYQIFDHGKLINTGKIIKQ